MGPVLGTESGAQIVQSLRALATAIATLVGTATGDGWVCPFFQLARVLAVLLPAVQVLELFAHSVGCGDDEYPDELREWAMCLVCTGVEQWVGIHSTWLDRWCLEAGEWSSDQTVSESGLSRFAQALKTEVEAFVTQVVESEDGE